MTLQQQINNLVKNIKRLRAELRAAFFFKNQGAIEEISARLVTLHSQYFDISEQDSYADAEPAIGSSVSARIDVSE